MTRKIRERSITSPRHPVPNVHLQAHDDLLLVINARDLFADARFADEKVYYTRSVGETVSDVREKGWSAGLRIFDISTPDKPQEIAFLSLNGIGIHRIWYVGGRWAYVSALIDGFSDYIFLTIDLADPRKPEVAGRWWLPGMNQAAGRPRSGRKVSAMPCITRLSPATPPTAAGATAA